MIRRAELRDLERLREVERAAGEAFRDVGMAAVADDESPAPADLRDHQVHGRAWVATAGDGTDDGTTGVDPDVAVAYLLLDVVDGAAHVEQVSVHPAWARRGLGRRLIETAAAWAAGRGLTAVTLTTFAEVPWNAPYYARLGFSVLPESELGPGLRAVRRRERDLGLDAWPRVAMRRPVPGRDGRAHG